MLRRCAAVSADVFAAVSAVALQLVVQLVVRLALRLALQLPLHALKLCMLCMLLRLKALLRQFQGLLGPEGVRLAREPDLQLDLQLSVLLPL